MAMFNFRGMGSNLLNLGRYGAGRIRSVARPWALGAGVLMGAGALAGGINPNRSMAGGAGTALRGGISGAFTGGMVGALGGAGYAGAVGLKGLGMGRKLGMNILGSARRYGMRGLKGGALLGGAFGVLKSGVTANRPANRIRGLYR